MRNEGKVCVSYTNEMNELRPLWETLDMHLQAIDVAPQLSTIWFPDFDSDRICFRTERHSFIISLFLVGQMLFCGSYKYKILQTMEFSCSCICIVIKYL